MKKLVIGLVLLSMLCAVPAALAADPDEFSVNAPSVSEWHEEDGTWRNGDDSQRFPSFEDLMDFLGIWVCGWYGCLG